jgi:hypothetical protein
MRVNINKDTDYVLAAMRRAHVEETRENYIYWAFAGDPPAGELDAEIEAALPVQFRRETLEMLDENKEPKQ